MADSRFITFVTSNPTLTVTALRGDPPQRTGGWAVWTRVPRPRRKDSTVYSGVAPLQQTVSVILGVRPGPTKSHGIADGSQLNLPATLDCNTLERMGRPPSEGAEPPIVRVIGAVPHNDVNWIVDDFDWATDDNVIYSTDGYITRQPVTVHLLEYVAADRVEEATAAGRARNVATTKKAAASQVGKATVKKTANATTPYIVTPGDTLVTIAAYYLGDSKRWTEIAALNGIRDPRNVTTGEHLRLPG